MEFTLRQTISPEVKFMFDNRMSNIDYIKDDMLRACLEAISKNITITEKPKYGFEEFLDVEAKFHVLTDENFKKLIGFMTDKLTLQEIGDFRKLLKDI